MKTLSKPRSKMFMTPRHDKAYCHVLAWLFDTFTLPVQKSSYKCAIGFNIEKQRATKSTPEHLKYWSFSVTSGVLNGTPVLQTQTNMSASSAKRSNVGEVLDVGTHLLRIFSKDQEITPSKITRRYAWYSYNTDLGYTEEMLQSIPGATKDESPVTKSVQVHCSVSSSYYEPRVSIKGVSEHRMTVCDYAPISSVHSPWLSTVGVWYKNSKKK